MPMKDRFRVNTSARRTITLVFSLTLFAALAMSYAPAADAQYLYCWTANLRTGSDQMFFSRVFPGDVSERGPMQIAFQKYVNENYRDSNPGPGACKNYSSRRDAESDLALDLKEKRDFEKQQVVETGWTFHAKTNTTHYYYCMAWTLRMRQGSQGDSTNVIFTNVFQYPGKPDDVKPRLEQKFRSFAAAAAYDPNPSMPTQCWAFDSSEAAAAARGGVPTIEVQWSPK